MKLRRTMFPRAAQSTARKGAEVAAVEADVVNFVQLEQMIVARVTHAAESQVVEQVSGKAVADAVDEHGVRRAKRATAMVDVVIDGEIAGRRERIAIAAGKRRRRRRSRTGRSFGRRGRRRRRFRYRPQRCARCSQGCGCGYRLRYVPPGPALLPGSARTAKRSDAPFIVTSGMPESAIIAVDVARSAGGQK